MRSFVTNTPGTRWLLHAEDAWYFLVAFVALIQTGREARLTANVTPGALAEIERDAFLADAPLAGAFSIPAILAAGAPDANPNTSLAIDPDNTRISLYTSGTTGKPKIASQRLTELENDNAFILSKWGDEWIGRTVCSTVSHHHIYGLLFSVMLPFTAGVPFRRERVETPEELFALVADDVAPVIVTVPAFLKRCEWPAVQQAHNITDRRPFVWTSGGALAFDVARKTNAALGFWPVEVYGSTETSGIAWRQSKNGPQWTPFDNVHLSLTDDGCLIVRSPYVRAPEGFATGDLVEILADGRFILQGRADNIVKVEEKRVSLAEVEARLLATGLVSECAVIARTGRRQYLVAALALNDAGKTRFTNTPKVAMNRFFTDALLAFFEPVVVPKRWRYVTALPTNPQGKKTRDAIEALFD
jgi:acyl-coenzyme A synthetase/AMP-(fatty) acid ligase